MRARSSLAFHSIIFIIRSKDFMKACWSWILVLIAYEMLLFGMIGQTSLGHWSNKQIKNDTNLEHIEKHGYTDFGNL